MGFKNAASISDAHYDAFFFRKVSSLSFTAGYFIDLTMVSGNPKPLFYASEPLVPVQLKKSTHGGFDYDEAKDGERVFIKRIAASNTTSVNYFMLMDYLAYLPFLAQDDNEEQIPTESMVPSRYADGVGLKMMMVSTNASSSSSTFTVKYRNQSGVIKTTPSVTAVLPLASQVVNIITGANPFIPLAAGDTGITEILSVTFNGAGTGLSTLVLVKPLCTFWASSGYPKETDYFTDRFNMPEIMYDAYISAIAVTGTATTLSIIGELQTVRV